MKTKLKTSMALLASVFLWVSCAGGGGTSPSAMDPVDYVNPYMGNISHLLVPTFPTVHLPNSIATCSIRSVRTSRVTVWAVCLLS